MKWLIFAGLLPVFVFTNLSVIAQEDEQMLFSIEGKVIDFNKQKPVKDAIVKLIPEGGISAETHTDKKGRYKFETIGDSEDRYVVPSTNYTILVHKPGYQEAEMLESTIGRESSAILTIDFELLKLEEK